MQSESEKKLFCSIEVRQDVKKVLVNFLFCMLIVITQKLLNRFYMNCGILFFVFRAEIERN